MVADGRRIALRSLAVGYQIDRAPALARLRAGTKYVPGRGALGPRYAFIGEAPGAAEENLRRPFCGSSGRVLDEMLSSIGLDREQVWVTNVLKYRPPRNRDPHPDEKRASLPYLKRELQLVAPMYVVTLGRHALEAMDPTLRLAQVHGEWQTVAGWPWLMPLYHPAVALYRATMRTTLMKDFAGLLEVPNA
jgi:uracil-DNA glycosylase family 4